MRRFFSLISANKGKIFMGLGSGVVIGCFGYLYNQDPNLSIKQPTVQPVVKTPIKPLDFKQECAKFRKTINIYNPSLQDIKKAVAFSFNIKKQEIVKCHEEMIESRLPLKKQGNLKEYFNAAKSNKLKQTLSSLLFTVLSEIGLTGQDIEPYQDNLSKMFREQIQKFSYGEEASLDFMKQFRKKQNKHLKKHGEQFVSHVASYFKNYDIETKKKVPDFFMIYLTDEFMTLDQQAQKYDMKAADRLFEKQLRRQNGMLGYQIQNLVKKLASQLGIPQNPQKQ